MSDLWWPWDGGEDRVAVEGEAPGTLVGETAPCAAAVAEQLGEGGGRGCGR